MAKTILAAVVSVCISSLASSAQESDMNARLKGLTALPSNNSDYRLGPGDLIEIRVFGVSNFDQTLRISASGTIKLPLIDTVKAEGYTASELEHHIAAKLDGDVIKDPQVSVFVKEYRSQPVTVLGAVRNPGQILITLQLRIVDVLSLAGGLQPNAGDEVTIQRRAKEGQEDEIIKVNLRQLLERGDLSLNTVVRGGDTIHVQERLDLYVYVVGELNRGGAFPIPPKQEVRVS